MFKARNMFSTTAERLVENQAEVFLIINWDSKRTPLQKKKALSSLKNIVAYYFRQTFFQKSQWIRARWG